jgi:CRISPR/Cas system endoribonuclease Cas6 (RAMP superfamily)
MRKAPGDDLITNEHIIHGDKPLHSCLLKLFNAVVNQDVWHVKESPMLKAVHAKHESKFAALSPTVVKAAI